MLVLCSFNTKAQWQDVILNYDRSDYGRAAQTWRVYPGNGPFIYFANQDGLFQYDHCQWVKYKLGDAENVRSALVSPEDERIYVGGIHQFGYFSISDNGALEYTSISDRFENPEIRYAGNIWDVYRQGKTLIFRTEDRVIRIEDNEGEVLYPESEIGYSCMIDDALHVATNKGLMVLMGSKFFTIHGSESVAKHRIRGVLPQGKNYLVFTANDGIYLLDGFNATPISTEADQFMKENEVFCIASNANKIAIGTVRDGLVIMDKDGKNPVFYNENSGLQNNTVLSLAFDYEGNLWAGLDRGISCISMSMPFKKLIQEDISIGLGYAAAIHNDNLYLGTNRGLYVMDQGINHLSEVSGLKGQVWDLCEIDSKLYCTTDNGLFWIDGKQVHQIAGIPAVWTLQPVLGDSALVYAGTYTGLWMLSNEKGVLRPLRKVEGMNDSFRIFHQGENNEFWIVNNDDLVKIIMNSALDSVLQRHEYNIPHSSNLCFFPDRSPMSILTDQGMMTYNAPCDTFVLDSLINEKYLCETTYFNVSTAFGRYYLLAKNHINVFSLDGEKNKDVYPFSSAMIEGVEGFERIIPINAHQAIVPSENGFMLFTAADSKDDSLPNHFRIRHIFSTDNDSILFAYNFMDKKPLVKIPFSDNNILVEFFSDNRIEGVLYQCRIKGQDWSKPSSIPIRQFSSLSPGQHTIEAKALYPDGIEMTDCITVNVLAPWYRSIWAYFIYALLFVIALWLLYRWDKKRTRAMELQAAREKEEEMLQKEQELEVEIARQEEQIESLEHQRLQDELKHKSLEMANMMVNVTQKNEMLSDIKRQISKVIDDLKGEEVRESRKQLRSLCDNIDSNINNQEVVERIEEQFDLLHDNFMKRLTDQYPTLTVNERMMCAYLKMQLSTKEIAQIVSS